MESQFGYLYTFGPDNAGNVNSVYFQLDQAKKVSTVSLVCSTSSYSDLTSPSWLKTKSCNNANLEVKLLNLSTPIEGLDDDELGTELACSRAVADKGDFDCEGQTGTHVMIR